MITSIIPCNCPVTVCLCPTRDWGEAISLISIATKACTVDELSKWLKIRLNEDHKVSRKYDDDDDDDDSYCNYKHLRHFKTDLLIQVKWTTVTDQYSSKRYISPCWGKKQPNVP